MLLKLNVTETKCWSIFFIYNLTSYFNVCIFANNSLNTLISIWCHFNPNQILEIKIKTKNCNSFNLT